MSSLRNAIPQKPYRERAQPGNRTRHGLLEKKKDYKLRAKDHNVKKAKLKVLTQKARDRNPDEFYFGMVNARTGRDGRKRGDDGGRGNEALTHDVVKLLKTQDAGYIRTMLQRVRKERERLEEQLTAVEAGGEQKLQALDRSGSAKRRLFVDNMDEMDSVMQSLTASGTAPEPSDSDDEFKDNDDEDDDDEDAPTKDQLRKNEALRKTREKRQKRLEDARTREKQLARANLELEKQRASIAGVGGGVNKNGIKFRRRERKR